MPDPIVTPAPEVKSVEGEAKPTAADTKPNPATNPGADDKTKAAADAALRKWKLKFDDVEEEVDEATLLKYAQETKSSQKRFQEAANTKKEAEAFFNLVKSAGDDPRLLEKVFSHPSMGNKNFRDVAEKYLLDKIKYEEMDPKEKELMEAKERLKQYDEAEKEAAKAEEDAKSAAQTQEYRDKFEKDIHDTLEASSLPKNEKTVARIAYYMNLDLKNGKQPVAAAVVDRVREEYITEIKEMFGHESTTAEALVALLGDVVVDKVRKFDIEKLKKKPGSVVPKVSPKDDDKGKLEGRKSKSYIRQRLRNAPNFGEE